MKSKRNVGLPLWKVVMHYEKDSSNRVFVNSDSLERNREQIKKVLRRLSSERKD